MYSAKCGQPIRTAKLKTIASSVRLVSMTARMLLHAGRRMNRRRNRIKSARRPGVATKNARKRQPAAAPYAVREHGFDRIGRAARVVSAVVSEHRRQRQPVEPDGPYGEAPRPARMRGQGHGRLRSRPGSRQTGRRAAFRSGRSSPVTGASATCFTCRCLLGTTTKSACRGNRA